MPIILIVCALLELVLSFYFKYSTNSIPLSDLNFFYIGNVLSSIPSVLLITGVVVQYFLDKRVLQKYKVTFNTLAIIVALCFIMLFMIQDVAFNDNLMLGFSIAKLSHVVLFSVSKFAIIYIMAIVWAIIIYEKKLVRLRGFVIACASVLLLLVFAFLYNLRFNPNSTVDEGNNFAIVFGAAVWSGDKPSPMFKARIDKSFELYDNKKIKAIQVTGGHAPGELSEAKTAENRLIELGVRKKDILIEDQTSNTSEQVKYIHQQITTLNKQYTNIILISDTFHLPRIMTICDFLGISAMPCSSEYQLKWEKLLYYRFRESLALLLFWNFGI